MVFVAAFPWGVICEPIHYSILNVLLCFVQQSHQSSICDCVCARTCVCLQILTSAPGMSACLKTLSAPTHLVAFSAAVWTGTQVVAPWRVPARVSGNFSLSPLSPLSLSLSLSLLSLSRSSLPELLSNRWSFLGVLVHGAAFAFLAMVALCGLSFDKQKFLKVSSQNSWAFVFDICLLSFPCPLLWSFRDAMGRMQNDVVPRSRELFLVYAYVPFCKILQEWREYITLNLLGFSWLVRMALIHIRHSGVHLPLNKPENRKKYDFFRFPGQNLGELVLNCHEGEVKML